MYKIHVDNSLSDAINFMTDGRISHISDSHPKVREVSDRLVTEGYNPYELLLYFANERVGIGGFDEFRIINRWTSDAVWIGFKEYKQRMREVAKQHYTIECKEVNTRLNNNLSTRQEILTTNICSFDAAGPVVKFDLAMRWNGDYPDPVFATWINQKWQLAMLHIMALPEFLPYVNTFRNYLLQEGSVYETDTPNSAH